MTLRLLQIRDENGQRIVAAMDDDGAARRVTGVDSVYDLATRAIASERTLADGLAEAGLGEPIDLSAAISEGRVLCPIDHPDPAHMLVTGTGLTHLGSAESRDRMHRAIEDGAPLSDSLKMFKLGLDGGKPVAGEAGAQPEWFYKGDGSGVTPPGAPITSPGFALDGGEEPEIVGIYVIGPDGTPFRLGFTLGNEFSDHVTERQNYLYLAHSKLRACALGPELLTGPFPDEVRGASRILRGDQVLWERPFLSGTAHMCHALENLEHHHFKYDLFRRPGDVHVHFMGTSTLSFTDGVTAEPGDVFEIEAAPFLLPLRNALRVAPARPVTTVRSL